MRRLALLTGLLVLAACGGEEAATTGPSVAGFELRAEAIAPGAAIEVRHTCDGEDVSPALGWEGVPDGTLELALVVDDPDAGGFTHWLVYGLPSGVSGLPEGVPPTGEVEGPVPLRQGENDFGDTGWGGPCPPEGEEHRYVFRLLALDAELALDPGADRGDFENAVDGHVLAEARLEASYGRPN